jgi:hypothetical protein
VFCWFLVVIFLGGSFLFKGLLLVVFLGGYLWGGSTGHIRIFWRWKLEDSFFFMGVGGRLVVVFLGGVCFGWGGGVVRGVLVGTVVGLLGVFFFVFFFGEGVSYLFFFGWGF